MSLGQNDHVDHPASDVSVGVTPTGRAGRWRGIAPGLLVAVAAMLGAFGWWFVIEAAADPVLDFGSSNAERGDRLETTRIRGRRAAEATRSDPRQESVKTLGDRQASTDLPIVNRRSRLGTLPTALVVERPRTVTRSLAVLTKEFEGLLRKRPLDRRSISVCLAQIAGSRDPESTTFLLGLLESTEHSFAGRLQLVGELLFSLDDPRIGPAAMAVVEANLRDGRRLGSDEAAALLRLVVGTAGTRGEAMLARLLRTGGSTWDVAAVSAIECLHDSRAIPELLSVVEGSPLASQILRELARSSLPGVEAAIVTWSEQPDRSPRLRRIAARYVSG